MGKHRFFTHVLLRRVCALAIRLLNETVNCMKFFIAKSCWKARSDLLSLRRLNDSGIRQTGDQRDEWQTVPHHMRSPPRQPLEAIPCLLRLRRSSPKRKKMAKDRCVSRQARCTKKFDTGLSFFAFFYLPASARERSHCVGSSTE